MNELAVSEGSVVDNLAVRGDHQGGEVKTSRAGLIRCPGATFAHL